MVDFPYLCEIERWVDRYCDENGREDFPQYDEYIEVFADKYAEDYKEYWSETEADRMVPVDYGTFLADIVGEMPIDVGDYAQQLRNDIPYQLAEAHRDEFGW